MSGVLVDQVCGGQGSTPWGTRQTVVQTVEREELGGRDEVLWVTTREKV